MNKNLGTGIYFLIASIVFCIGIKELRAPMIVVQGSIQLWPVTIINNTHNLTLIVTDEIIDPHGSSHIVRYLPSLAPNNQFTFQWPSTFEKPNARRISIVSKKFAVLKTNKIVIGNTPDATYPMVPSGDFSIISSGYRSICIADKLHPRQCSGK